MKFLITLLLLIPSLTYADSLTISPFGMSIHGYDVSGLDNVPRSVGTKQVVWHPELMLGYKTEHMSYAAFWMKDCIDNHAGGAFFGPKQNLGKYFELGASGGFLVRNPQIGSFRFLSMSVNKNVEIVPLVGATLSARIPITKRMDLEVNAFTNYFITHTTFGLRVNF